ncbi:MAG: 50S ribosomal protein L9 [Spirochaetes bacterium ADurb.BinA120]|nr:MAG: 50S ribosomal protein L9 [Spirochaetes bacterium ADurb.BinA120]
MSGANNKLEVLTMKVILQKDIPNLGEAGDIKEVSNGYARNYLLPRKLVLLASDSSRKAVEHQKKLIKIKKEKRKKQSETLMEALSALEIQIGAQVGEEEKLFGSVTSMDIARRLKELGHEVDRRKIHLDEPIKRLGEYRVPVKLDDGVTANIKVTVFKE